MSPKSNTSGVSYDDSDPRSHSLNPQAVPAQGGPRVTRARDFGAAVEGLDAPRPDDEMNDSSVNDRKQELGGLEEVQSVEGDGTGETLPPVRDYGTWTKARLNEELDQREIEHDPKANNNALIDLLEDDDQRAQDFGDGTPAQSV